MKMRRLLAAIGAASAITAVGAFASSGSISSQTLAAGTRAVARCDANPAWTYSFNKTGGGNVQSIDVGNIAATCAGGSISVGTSPAGATGGPTPLTCGSGSCSATVTLNSSPLPAGITSVTAVIAGP